MARFNLADYETVEERIRRFTELYPDGRIVTEWCNEYEAVEKPRTWVVKAYVYLTAGDQANKLPKATGLAFEVDGTGGANQTSALENAETSCIGRALANMNLSGNKRASRTEMEKVVRAESKNYLAEADKLTDVTALRLMWAEAKSAGVDSDILDRIKERANEVSGTSSISAGTEGSVSTLGGEDSALRAAWPTVTGKPGKSGK